MSTYSYIAAAPPPDYTSVLQGAMVQQIYIIEDNQISVDPKLKYYVSIETRILHIDAKKLNSRMIVLVNTPISCNISISFYNIF